MGFTRIGAAVSVVAAVVAGCSPSARSSPSTTPSEPEVTKITLSYQPSGTAALSWDRQSQTVTANLQMAGFTPDRTYAVDIRKGTCATPTDVAVPFPKVTADRAGTINTTVVAERPAPGGLLPRTALFIDPNAGAEPGAATEPGNAQLACAEIDAAVAATTLAMGPVGPRPGGWATATYNAGNQTLVVATWASGLAPGSAHTQQIGLGTCESREPAKYVLKDLVASANGSAYQTSVIEDVDQQALSSDWYLDVQSGTGQPPPSDAPILCGSTGQKPAPTS